MTAAGPADLPAVRIDPDNEWTWCGDRHLRLTPRAFAVLHHLVEHAHRLVTKDDLLATVWRDSIVSEAAMTSCIRDLRKELGDASDRPRYIETVHRRGFRFIGPIDDRTMGPSATTSAPPPTGARSRRWSSGSTPLTARLVGREVELSELRARMERALAGHRQLVFVTGEPGIGKTAFVDAFLA